MLTDAEKLARFQRALDQGGNTHTVADVFDKVRAGRAAFWENGDGIAVTEVLVYPRLRALNYWLLSGVLRDVLAMEDEISAWGRENGATVATASGRAGWGRIGEPRGWIPRGRMWWKPLGGLQ